MKIIFLLLYIPFLVWSQPHQNTWVNQHQEDYKNVIKNFYALLYGKQISNQKLSNVYWNASLDSEMSKKIKPYLKELTGGLPKNEVFEIIDKAEVSDEGLQFSVYVELSFLKAKRIYFGLSSDIPTIIEYIWLSDGTLLNSKIEKKCPAQKLLLVGAISDKDDYTNIRDKPLKNAKVIDKITDQEYFYYVPNGNSNWWQVSRKDEAKAIIGYVHKSRILKYSVMPDEIKIKVIKDRKSD